MRIKKLDSNEILILAETVVRDIILAGLVSKEIPLKVFPIPRGGIPAAYALLCAAGKLIPGSAWAIVDNPKHADIFMDDIIDSGETMKTYCDLYPGIPFFALVDKLSSDELADCWITFPWEDNDKEVGIEANITRLLQFIGEDPKRGGLIDTPKRVVKAWQHWAGGYDTHIPDILRTFEDGAHNCDEMVVVRNIPFYTHCEHHMAPFFGTVTVGYVPDGRIVGLSKIPRVVDAFARRLQVQERLTNQIADAIQNNLTPLGVGVVVKARHLCMESRGIKQQGSETVTSALRGVIKSKPEARSEFLELATK